MPHRSIPSNVTIYVDGSSRGNPGPAGIGVAIFAAEDQNAPLHELSKYIGVTTNNVAEYEAVIYALKWLVANNVPCATIKLDSELVYRQITKKYRARLPHIVALLKRIRALSARVRDVAIVFVPRSDNKFANRLAQRASKKPSRHNSEGGANTNH